LVPATRADYAGAVLVRRAVFGYQPFMGAPAPKPAPAPVEAAAPPRN
jgi:hypothetical protein